jgi:hypothetical protein
MRAEQHIGREGEELAAIMLRNYGVSQLERIGTPVRQVRGRIIYGEPVAADFRGVISVTLFPHSTNLEIIGQSVMAEVKTVDHNLRWSDFREHQPGKLTEHAELGGLSLVVWVHSSGVYILRWPIPGFSAGHGLTPEMAGALT